MKYTVSIILIGMFQLSSLPVKSQGIYDSTVLLISGQQYSLQALNGKKTMVVTLPVSNSYDDSLFLNKLDSIAFEYKDKLNIIGVPSYEDGYSDSILTIVNQLYQDNILSGIVILQPMYTRKTSGDFQSDFFRWLTDSNMNGHFSNDVTGVNHKFFLNELGELNIVLGPEVPLTFQLVQKILQ